MGQKDLNKLELYFQFFLSISYEFLWIFEGGDRKKFFNKFYLKTSESWKIILNIKKYLWNFNFKIGGSPKDSSWLHPWQRSPLLIDNVIGSLGLSSFFRGIWHKAGVCYDFSKSSFVLTGILEGFDWNKNFQIL